MSNPFRDRMRWSLVGWMFVISAIAYLDRVNIAIAGHSIQQEFHLDNIQLGWVFSAFVAGLCALSGPRRQARGPFWPAQDSGVGYGLVGGVHCPHRAGSLGSRPGARDLAGGAVCPGLGRGGGLPGFQPAGVCVDSLPGTRLGERLDLCRCGRGGRRDSSPDYVHPGELRLAMVILDQRAHRTGSGRRLVFGGPRPPRRSSLGERRRSRATSEPGCRRRPPDRFRARHFPGGPFCSAETCWRSR